MCEIYESSTKLKCSLLIKNFGVNIFNLPKNISNFELFYWVVLKLL